MGKEPHTRSLELAAKNFGMEAWNYWEWEKNYCGKELSIGVLESWAWKGTIPQRPRGRIDSRAVHGPWINASH